MGQLLVRVVLAFITVAMVAATVPPEVAAAGYRVEVNGWAVPGTVAEIRSGQLMVSVRPFVEAMGGTVAWNPVNRQVTVNQSGSQVALWVGNTLVYQDGKRLWAPVAPYLKDGRSMVPAWWLAVRLGAAVRWTGDSLVVTTPGPTSAPRHSLARPEYVFPFPQGAKYSPFVDTMGAPRFWLGEQFGHEGIDIFAQKGTPIVAVASGTVVRFGWNTLGGYRVTIRLDDYPEYRFYYAHMDGYAPGIGLGSWIRKGQLLGYVGDTGEGPERTEGKFPTHLHFGIYGPNGAIDSFELLRYWERNIASL